jgi:hypothetical protein
MQVTHQMKAICKEYNVPMTRLVNRVLELKSAAITGELPDKLQACFLLEPYGVTMAGEPNAPTQIEFLEFLQEISSNVIDEKIKGED